MELSEEDRDLFGIFMVIFGIILIAITGAIWLFQIPYYLLMTTLTGSGISALIVGLYFWLLAEREPTLIEKPPKKLAKTHETKPAKLAAGPEEFVLDVMFPKADSKRLPIETIEGIGIVYGERLRKGRIDYVEDLALSTPKRVSKLCDVNQEIAKKWIAMARLTWLDDVSEEDAEALVLAANITSIEQLAVAEPEHLYTQVTKGLKEGRFEIPAGYRFTQVKAKKWVASAQKEIHE